MIFWWGSTVVVAEDSKAELHSVLNQITEVKTELTKKKQQQISVQEQLGDLKKKIGVLSSNLRETTQKLRRQKKFLLKLIADQAQQQRKFQEVHSRLASQLNLAYELRPPTGLKVLLNREKVTPNLVLAYHDYIFVARFNQMRDIKAALRHLEQNRQKIGQQTKELESLDRQQKGRRLELEKTKNRRNLVLGDLKNKITEQNKRLSNLLLAKRNLERLVNSLTPYAPVVMSPRLKAQFCRNFIWPTKGVIAIHFGSSIEQSSWRWNGVVIDARRGQEVYAVSGGRVVYADLLTGYGLLLIIDHGSGYMSLYGYNRNFHKKLNAVVGAGEVIASVGDNGDGRPQLYFAIRYNGKPVNPEGWCR